MFIIIQTTADALPDSVCREHDAVKTGSLVKDEDWAADVATQFTDRALVVLRKEKDENCIAKKSGKIRIPSHGWRRI